MVTLIISGGQTGADRAALQFALDNGIPHSGWCPKGRLAEDGVIPHKFQLIETKSAEYPPRTEKNVKESDGTIIFNASLKGLERGCALTERLCIKHHKPCFILIGIGEERIPGHRLLLMDFIDQNEIAVLNVAGNRESKAPGIYEHVLKVFTTLPERLFQHHKFL